MKLLVASGNLNKIAEIRAVFALPSVELIGAPELSNLPAVIEDCDSFAGNAVKKAMLLALASGLWTLADDSGLEVDALSGAPGVRSARFAGEKVDHAANNRLLLGLLSEGMPRQARFRCVIALSSPAGRAQTVEAVCEGCIAEEPKGAKGFGYDPIFIPSGCGKSFAEMSESEKNEISHRGKALRSALETWGSMLRKVPRDWNEW